RAHPRVAEPGAERHVGALRSAEGCRGAAHHRRPAGSRGGDARRRLPDGGLARRVVEGPDGAWPGRGGHVLRALSGGRTKDPRALRDVEVVTARRHVGPRGSRAAVDGALRSLSLRRYPSPRTRAARWHRNEAHFDPAIESGRNALEHAERVT